MNTDIVEEIQEINTCGEKLSLSMGCWRKLPAIWIHRDILEGMEEL